MKKTRRTRKMSDSRRFFEFSGDSVGRWCYMSSVKAKRSVFVSFSNMC